MIDAMRQIAAIREVLALGVDVWLRGGWAMDFYLGEITRPHVDIDWFAWSRDAGRIQEALGPAAAVSEQQLDFLRDDIDMSFALIDRKDGQVIVAGGQWAGTAWPDGMLDGPPGRIGDLTCPIVSVAAQIEIKEMMPIWNPAFRRRDKDREDIARLRAKMSAGLDF